MHCETESSWETPSPEKNLQQTNETKSIKMKRRKRHTKKEIEKNNLLKETMTTNKSRQRNEPVENQTGLPEQADENE